MQQSPGGLVPRLYRQRPILMYHSLTATTGMHPESLAVARFRRQLVVLRALGYRSVPPRVIAEHLRPGNTPPPRSVALAFDDGYLDTVTVALPLLREFGFSATCYLVAGAVGGESHWTTPAPLMDWSGVRDWLAADMEIGCHTATHPDLTKVGDAALHTEVVGAKRRLEDRLGVPIRSFAYPFNRVDRRSVEAVEAAGYTDGVAGPEPHRTPYALSRVNAVRGSWMRFVLKLSPAYPALWRFYRALVPCSAG